MTETNAAASVRLNKYLSEAGVCSRREADRLIETGKVTIDGVTAVVGSRVEPGAEVCVDGKKVGKKSSRVILAVHKPTGVIVTSEVRKGTRNIDQLVQYPTRVFPVGRLDKDSEGLLLMTNDGDLVNKIMRAGNYHEKEYVVTVDRPITPSFLKTMREGVAILDTVTRPCKVDQIGRKAFRIVLTQGLNRQIRRMCEALNYRVQTLKRERIMNIELGDLPVGTYRELTQEEEQELDALLKNSSSAPIQYPKEVENNHD